MSWHAFPYRVLRRQTKDKDFPDYYHSIWQIEVREALTGRRIAHWQRGEQGGHHMAPYHAGPHTVRIHWTGLWITATFSDAHSERTFLPVAFVLRVVLPATIAAAAYVAAV